MVYLGIMEWCKKCGGSDANCPEYTKQPHYVINASAPSNQLSRKEIG